MRHFPIFLDLRGFRVAVAGGDETAVSKLRLLLKTEAKITVHSAEINDTIRRWHDAGKLRWHKGPFGHEHAICARLVYAATDDPAEDERVEAIGRGAGALVNLVDNLEDSHFITPAIVDRDPVTVAIGTEGAAPVLARRIKADTEARLNPQLGVLARIANGYRPRAEHIPAGGARRSFWSRFFDVDGPAALAKGGEAGVHATLERLLAATTDGGETKREGQVVLVGAGPGDPELLTLKARHCLHEADVVVYDRLVDPSILELARREALLIEVGKTPGGPSWKQADIDAELIRHAKDGLTVARLKSGDPLMFGRADEEIDALEAAGIEVSIIPGITAAAAAAASVGVSLTRRGRNRAITFLTAHDADGFAEHDWRALAAPDTIFAVYMGVRAARFLLGRMLLHGAPGELSVTVVENASRPNEKIVAGRLADLVDLMSGAGITGPAIIFVGLAPRAALAAVAPLAQAVGEG